MIDFKELKILIQKASITSKSTISDMFSFEIDTEKLEDMLNKKSDLHVLRFTPEVKSAKPTTADYALISEYIYKKEAFDGIYDGQSQVASFIIYCDKEGTVNIPGLTPETIKDFYNLDLEKQVEIANYIMAELPVYRTLVIRRFNIREEKFDYLIYFRSNRVMINYIKNLREVGQFENNSGEVDVVEAEPPVENPPVTEEIEELTVTAAEE